MKKLSLLVFVKIPLTFILASLAIVLLYKWTPVYFTPLMARRAVQFHSDSGFRTQKQWVPLDRISAQMVLAVIASEDNKFDTHSGFDFEEIRKMQKEHVEKGKKIRGCSTISQQTAKNCFTWGTNTWIRKAFEAWWTILIETFWGKERIMEVYLNIIETGKGIYGVQSAALAYYGKDAATLTRDEASLIAACLPDPLRRSPAKPTKYLRQRQSTIGSLSRKMAVPDWLTER